MTAGIYNTTIDQGSVWSVVLVYTDSNNVPVNLTGYTAAMQLRQNYNSTTADLTLTTANGGITIVGATGTITINATATQTGLLDPGFYVYDLELTSGSNISRLIQGQLTVAEQVTRG
jgi:phage tail sheath gpL-like